MLSRLLRGQSARNKTIDAIHPAVSSLNEARLQAWTIFIGAAGRDFRHAASRRPGRAALPDVDLSRAVAMPRRPGIWRRLAGTVARFRRIASRRSPGQSATPDAESFGDGGAARYMSDRLNAFRRRLAESDPTSRAA